MTDLGDIKKETLLNQEKILDLEQDLKLKKIETRHLSSRITITWIVIFILSFLLILQLIMALTGKSISTQDIPNDTPTNGTIDKNTENKTVSYIMEEYNNEQKNQDHTLPDLDDDDDLDQTSTRPVE